MSASQDLPKPAWNLDGTINHPGHKLWPKFNELHDRTKKRGVRLELHITDSGAAKVVVREKMSPSTEVLRQQTAVHWDLDAAAGELLK